MDRFFELKVFVEVVEAGSLSGAADRLNVAKSVVSRCLKALESRLGAQLMVRTTRSQKLTESGAAFYERSLAVLAELDAAEEAVSDVGGTLRGRLRIAAPLTFGMLYVAPALLEFMDRHPDLLIDADFDDRRVDLVRDGFDMAIRVGVLPDSSLRARRLTRVRLVVCASPDYLEKFGLPRTPDDLEHHHCIRYSRVSNINVWHYRDGDKKTGQVHVPVRVLSTSGGFIRESAIAGVGLILVPTFGVGDALAAGSLVTVLDDYEWYEGAPDLNVFAVFPPGQYLSRRVRVFTDFIAERVHD
ncbi:MAG: LysR substrate-binding domain-containing protein [Rhodanobacteraceae bacterium]